MENKFIDWNITWLSVRNNTIYKHNILRSPNNGQKIQLNKYWVLFAQFKTSQNTEPEVHFVPSGGYARTNQKPHCDIGLNIKYMIMNTVVTSSNIQNKKNIGLNKI